ncbi:MAG: hypothetical protein K9N21_22950 [Deltaproteobacteria bacterium]|nr:hypothetical protein [Deltaproteobacteria bacterium]
MLENRKQESPALPVQEAIRLLLDLAPHIQISRHAPGKITIRFSLSSLGVLQDAGVGNFNQKIPGVRSAKVSLWRRTVDIEYDADQIPFEVWEDLVESNQNPEKRKDLRDRLTNFLKG